MAFINLSDFDDPALTDAEIIRNATANGGTVVFNRDYTIDREVINGGPTTLELDGFTINRADSFKTTVGGDHVEGATTITVADASGFKVGQEVAFVVGKGSRNDIIAREERIVNITGNELTVSQGIDNPVPDGTYAIRVHNMFTNYSSLRIRGGQLVGNRAGQYTEAWQFNFAITGSGVLTAEDLQVSDMPSECFLIHGNSRVSRITANDLNGSLVHVSNNLGDLVLIEDISATNICQSTKNGHNECPVTFSFKVSNVDIRRFTTTNCGTGALPNLSYEDAGNIVIDQWHMTNCARGGGANTSTRDSKIEKIHVSNSSFTNIGTKFSYLGRNLESDFVLSDILFRDTTFGPGCELEFKKCKNVTMDNVTLDKAGRLNLKAEAITTLNLT